MIKELATACMLVGAIAPYKTAITQEEITNLALQSNAQWVITTNQNNDFAKNQITKASYENTLIKVEQIKISIFTASVSEENQEIEAFLFTRITRKQDLSYFQLKYLGEGGGQTYQDSFSINDPDTQYAYEYYSRAQSSSSQATFNNLFAMETLNYALIFLAQTVVEGGELIRQNNTIDGLNEFGCYNWQRTYTSGYDLSPVVYMERVYENNLYIPDNPEFEDLIVWNNDYNFFYNQPYNTKLTYTWEIDPATVNNYEVIDVQGLLLTILGMPMAWITQAFNFTLWPGTPYALNVGHILSAVIIASVIIIIIKKVYN